jgi:hypothetical protein
MSNVRLFKSYTAGAAINAYTLVKFSAAETVVTAAAATDLIIGVTSDVGPAINERVDVALEGIAFVVAGAACTLGAKLTSDASGRAVPAAPAAGVNNQVVGYAMEAASAAGDVIRMMLSSSVMQG